MNEEIQVNLAEVSAMLDDARALLGEIEQGFPEFWKFWDSSSPKLICWKEEDECVFVRPHRNGVEIGFGDSETDNYIWVSSVEEFASFANQTFRYMGGDFAVVHKKARKR
jgi:hypothetical protein